MAALIVFGDSLCDGGNAFALSGKAAVPSPPHWRGRRCDGPVWVEQLAQRLSLPPLRPSQAGGSNHAYGGARSGEGLSPRGVPNLLEQVEAFARSAAAEPAADPATDGTAGALVVLRAGANDYLDSGPSSAVAEAVNRHLLAAVDSLAARGFRRFLLPSELPWGFSPIQQPGFDGAARAGLNALIANQNAALGQALAARAAQGPLYIWQPDFHGLLLAVRADPTAFGFATVEAPVLSAEAAAAGAGGLAPPSAGFLWWDWGHFTTAFHSLLAQEAWSCLVGTTACDRPSAGSSVSWDPQGRRIWGAGSQRSPGSLS